MMEAREKMALMPTITFAGKDVEGIASHQDDPVVFLLITGGYHVGHVLVDGGGSTIMIFWTNFEGKAISKICYNSSMAP